LDRFGLIPEFIGRLPILAIMDDLGVDDLVQVLKEPKNSLVRQYEKLFKFEKVKLTYTEEE
jgi:ATP-dependent Clp protease ATP-binding subunit ClpX